MNDETVGHTNSYTNCLRNRTEFRMMFHEEKFKVLQKKKVQAVALLNLAFNGNLWFRTYPVLFIALSAQVSEARTKSLANVFHKPHKKINKNK